MVGLTSVAALEATGALCVCALGGLAGSLGGLEGSLGGLEGSLGGLEGSLGGLEGSLGGLEGSLGELLLGLAPESGLGAVSWESVACMTARQCYCEEG